MCMDMVFAEAECYMIALIKIDFNTCRAHVKFCWKETHSYAINSWLMIDLN
jgi:hypothetical protein